MVLVLPRSLLAASALCCAIVISACASDEPIGADPVDASASPDAVAADAAVNTPADAAVGLSDGGALADAGTSTTIRALTMSDVSILFPLPTSAADRDVLVAATADGVGGPLIPRALYDRTTPLLTALMPDEAYARLRAVSARVDPCPQRLTNQPCRPQLRLVLQPISGDAASTSAEDAALHAIYEIPVTDFASLIADLRALGDSEPELAADARLGVHPVMAREGLQGAYARGLRALILRHAGEARLVRLTFMQLSGRANVWIFGGFDRARDGTYAPTRIPGVNTPTQRITHNVFTDELRISVTPSVIDRDDFSVLYDSDVARSAMTAVRQAALAAALRVENPERHDPDSVDCARCHVAFVARRWTERVLGEDTSQSPDRFRAPGYDLAVPEVVTPPTSLRTFRAFGWLGREPAISPRTVHETAVVLQEL